MQRVIILRGVMASGKSTIAKRYRNFKDRTIWLKVDNFKDFFDILDSDVRTYIHGAANVSLEYFIKEGFSVVMDGVFQNPLYIQQAVSLAEKHKVPCKVFQLSVPLEILQQRDRLREGVPEGCRKSLGDEEIAKVYKVIEENKYPDAITLDTENMSIEESMGFIDQQFK